MGFIIFGGCILFMFWSVIVKPYFKDDDHPKDE
jgi:hypothetical protein